MLSPWRNSKPERGAFARRSHPAPTRQLFDLPAQTEDVKEVASSVTIETIGQAIKDKSDPTQLRLFRLMMTCCAADARPISMPIQFDDHSPTGVR